MKAIYVFLISILFDVTHGKTDTAVAIHTRKNFVYQIETNLFTNVAKPNIQFKASIESYPDLPKWMRLEQKTPTQPAFLYGTPPDSASGQVIIEIIGWNKDDYTTTKKLVRFTIEKTEIAIVKYQVDFKLPNLDLAEVLQNKRKKAEDFRHRVQKVWPAASVITDIDKSVDRPGGRFPLPGQKEGVFITLGSNSPPPTDLKNAKYCASTGQSRNPGSTSVYNEFTSEFTVSWCHLTLIELKDPSSQASGTRGSKYGFQETPYHSVSYDPSPRDMSLELMLVFVPILIGILFVVILTYIMCCKREGVRKRDAMTPREQLRHHRSLRNAAYQLRSMSSKDNLNDNPNGGFQYGPLDEEPYSEETQRRRPPRDGRGPPSSSPSTPESPVRPSFPPPYQMPPPMPSDQASDTDSVPSGPPPYRKPDGGRW